MFVKGFKRWDLRWPSWSCALVLALSIEKLIEFGMVWAGGEMLLALT